MRANETFSYLSNNPVSQDMTSLVRYYQPLMGNQALALYAYFLAFDDQGAQSHAFSEVLNHLNMGMPDLETALDKLTALQLLDFYQQGQGYLIRLRPPLDGPAFLEHQVLSALLARKIGRSALDQMKAVLPSDIRPLSKRLSEVFTGTADLAASRPKPDRQDFDLASFKQLMARERLRFEDEESDLLGLFNYAELGKKTWYETFQAAKATAVEGVISTKRLLRSLQTKPVAGDFSESERQLIRWAKSRTALEFLADIKADRKAEISDAERQTLAKLARLGLMDAVINVLVLYTFNRTDNANLNANYVLKAANDFSYQEINSAEAAILAIRKWQEPKPKAAAAKNQAPEKRASNVPDWSKETYRTEATPEERQRLEALRRRALGDEET